jgi:MSHA biogenesis protein MshO
MRPIRPEGRRRRARGVSLLELVVAIVVTGIIVAAVSFFAFPVRQSVDLAVRAELSDAAHTALQRITRDVRLALPNSVRVDGTQRYVEFLAIRTAGRYRAEGGGGSEAPDCPPDGLAAPDADQLSFDLSESCFKTIGSLPGAPVAGSDEIVLNNYGPGFSGQDAYEVPAANRVQISGFTAQTGRDRISFASTTFQRHLHDSAGKRFFVISGPVTYGCDLAAGTVTRYSGYAITAAQVTPPGGTAAPIAGNVTGCAFDYTPNIAPQVGLLTLRLTLSKATSGGTPETVSLYQAVHVSNVP